MDAQIALSAAQAVNPAIAGVFLKDPADPATWVFQRGSRTVQELDAKGRRVSVIVPGESFSEEDTATVTAAILRAFEPKLDEFVYPPALRAELDDMHQQIETLEKAINTMLRSGDGAADTDTAP